MNEKELDRVLGAALRDDDEFLSWLLARVGFDPAGAQRVLLRDDWPWGKPKGDQRIFRETDILLVCENADGVRFALHLENKGPRRPFGVDQASDYPIRARAWAGVEKWGRYSIWKCVLVAPRAYAAKAPVECSYFDAHVTYEEVAERLPEFAV
jgi:hypothetical protein